MCSIYFVISLQLHALHSSLQRYLSSATVLWMFAWRVIVCLALLCPHYFKYLCLSPSINYFHQKFSTHSGLPTHWHPRARRGTSGMCLEPLSADGNESREKESENLTREEVKSFNHRQICLPLFMDLFIREKYREVNTRWSRSQIESTVSFIRLMLPYHNCNKLIEIYIM